MKLDACGIHEERVRLWKQEQCTTDTDAGKDRTVHIKKKPRAADEGVSGENRLVDGEQTR